MDALRPLWWAWPVPPEPFAPVEPRPGDEAVPRLLTELGLPGMIDLHVHLLPERMQARVWAHFDQAGPLLGRPWPIRYRWPVADLVEHLRGMSVTAFTTMPYAHRPGMAADLNSASLALASSHPDVLPTLTFYPEPGVGEYVSSALQAGARAAKVHLQVGAFDPGAPVLEPAWRALAAARVPVVIHAGSGPVAGRFTGPGPIAAVLDAHPRLLAVIAHLGMPETSAFLDLVERRPNTYLDTTMSFTDFTEAWRPSSPSDLARLAQLSRRVVFGSDFPSIPYDYAHAVLALRRAGFDDDWLRAVLWDTPRALLAQVVASA